MPKPPRVIGTSEQAISEAEASLAHPFPASFRQWLLDNNGFGIEDIRIFPVFDERDPRKTWDSIVRQGKIARDYWTDAFGADRQEFVNLLPFADFGTGDYYCFDYSAPTEEGEYLVVLVSHETGSRSPKARTFAEFASNAASGAFADD